MTAKQNKRIMVYQRTQGRCAYCGGRLYSDFTVDHIIPKSKGGSSEIFNLVPACPECNRRKADRDLLEFLPIIGCLLDSFRNMKNAGVSCPN